KNTGDITLSQDAYVTKALERFGGNINGKPALSPMSTAPNPSNEEKPALLKLKQEYCGTLNYLATSTRLDIVVALKFCAKAKVN
ncbi:unnamed protein product, partial [Amoebophrya sp. A120]